MFPRVIRRFNSTESLSQFNVFSPSSTLGTTVARVGPSSFTLSGLRVVNGPVVLANGKVFLWNPPQYSIGADATSNASTDDHGVFTGWTPTQFILFQLLHPLPELLIIGSGATMQPLPPTVKRYLNELGIQTEVMQSKQAASTFNMLLQEERKVAAALLPIVPTSGVTGLPLVDIQSGRKTE